MGLLPVLAAALALAAPVSMAQDRGGTEPIRIFVQTSDSWNIVGNDVTVDGSGGGMLRGGAKPQTAEIMKTIGKRKDCQGILVTINRERADYILMLDRTAGRGVIRKDNKMALFNREGDIVTSSSTLTLGNAVKNACRAILGL